MIFQDLFFSFLDGVDRVESESIESNLIFKKHFRFSVLRSKIRNHNKEELQASHSSYAHTPLLCAKELRYTLIIGIDTNEQHYKTCF
jgi:hypothetical protein